MDLKIPFLSIDSLVGRLLATALLLGWLSDLLFFDKLTGISWLLFVLLLLFSLYQLGRSKGIRARRRNGLLLLPLLLLAAMVALRDNRFLLTLNLLGSLAFVGLLAHFYGRGRIGQLKLAGYPLILAKTALHTLVSATPLLPGALRRLSRLRSWCLLPVVRGLLLALPVLLVFTLFLASADLIFASYIERAFDILSLTSLLEGGWHLMWVAIISWLSAGLLAYALLDDGPRDTPGLDEMSDELQRSFGLGMVEATIVLGLVNLLFLLFVSVQAAYLFGGLATLTLDGYSYAEYARRGFFELVTVASLTLGLVMTLDWLTRRSRPASRLLFNGLGSLMVLLVVVILVSAFQRLRLYELAYGYTQLRLYVHVFMIWLALLLLWFGAGLWLPAVARRLAPGFVVAAVGFLLTLNLLNPDALIARHNVARYLAGEPVRVEIPDSGIDRVVVEEPPLDLFYLTRLSDDAVPTLVGAVDQMAGEDQATLCQNLYWRETQLKAEQRWQSWNWGRQQAQRALSQPDWKESCPPPSYR